MAKEQRPANGAGRRAEYAEQTKQAILEAGRTLFAEQGYFATKVEEIARTARVAPATVYAVGGGKSGILRTLMEAGVATEDVTEILARIQTATDPLELLTFLIRSTRMIFETWSPLMRQVVAAAPQEPSVRDSLEIAHRSLRGGLELTARRLDGLGALRVTIPQATDILWLNLCNTAYFIRTDDLGWSLDTSEKWLNETLPPLLLNQ
ncbi:TetR/AcrR family transcriptional regulator [Kineosporia mesophila]|uniref:TetR/AcrR family transcriptional regulator n=1 Tax=Kineosporia mesophila TaxID=566012 RepID=A0ABP7A2I7_9ACTN|nr:TetR/AcrR family transcriptional regulator [Kineosporia mesophila]